MGTMRVFGLTGGICTGKSTVARLFREEGIPVVDADAIARRLTAPGTAVHADVVRLFGPEILLADGRIDRARVRAIVFADPARRTALEAALHPRILAGMRQALSALASEGHDVAVVEAALIHELPRRGMFDAVIGVRCGRERQLARLMSRDGIPREEAERIVSSQMDADEKARASNYVIDNSGSLAETAAQVRAVAATLLRPIPGA